MKKLAYALFLLALSAPACLSVHAQSPAAQPRFTPDQVIAHYGQTLSLSDEQKAKLRPIIAERQQGMLDLKNDTSTPPRAKMQKMRSLKASTDKRINALLTPDQQKKYAVMEAEQMEKMKERQQSKTGAN